jgi:hypothetical protein
MCLRIWKSVLHDENVIVLDRLLTNITLLYYVLYDDDDKPFRFIGS